MSPRLSIIPAGAITDPTLEPRDLQVLCHLGCYTDKFGWCRRSQVKMAALLRCGRASVQRSLERLVETGWVEKRRPPWSNTDGQPSHSYEYRVILDRDDAGAVDTAGDDGDDPSHAETASDEGGCPPVGTPPDRTDEAGGVPTQAGHPGAQPYVGTGAHTYVGTKNDPLERPSIEREREARVRERTAKFLAAFEPRWPTSAIDDRQRTAYAAIALTETEQDEALAGIAPFIEMQQKAGRKAKIAGWRYLEEKRWQLLKTAAPQAATPGNYAPTSREGRALRTLYGVGRIEDLFFATVQRQGVVWWRGEIPPQALALAEAPPTAQWAKLSHQQAGAWEALLQRLIKVQSRRRLVAGDVAPWPWPPRVDGSLAADGDADPPQPAMTADDEDALSSEGGRG